MIIVFFYKIAGIIYHAKYIGHMSDDYEEGLDVEVRNLFYPILKKAYSVSSENDVCVGITFYKRDGVDYFSENEKYVFDVLYCNWSNQPVEIFVNGIEWKHKE